MSGTFLLGNHDDQQERWTGTLSLNDQGVEHMRENEQLYRPHLFIVRLWQEELGVGQTEWRGQVHSMDDGGRRAFRDWPELVAFFVAKLAEIEKG